MCPLEKYANQTGDDSISLTLRVPKIHPCRSQGWRTITCSRLQVARAAPETA
jgi:hypothetical protein